MSDKKQFSISDIIPTEEVASGMHQPVGESMFAVPSMADDEEELEKEALGLTSMPSSLHGGEVLELPGSPEPPGLSRETGDDEETDYFGAKEEDVDFPPEHFKAHRDYSILG